MAPPPPPPLVVQFIQFRANDRSMEDPSLFHALRDKVQQNWQEKGLKAQYWGTSVVKANEFCWLLFWQSHEHAIDIKSDPMYPTFIQERNTLSTTPIYEVHVRFSGNPLRVMQTPVTEIDIYKTTDERVDPKARPAAETQDMVRHITHRIESLQSPGFIANCWGIALEDGTRGVNINGWRSIDDHMRLGTLDNHKVFVEECEEVFKSFSELYVAHIHFKSHDVSSA